LPAGRGDRQVQGRRLSALRPAHIGCSGWNYPHWRERVYPRGLPARAWLEYHARLFDTVEVNTTFYRLAKPEVVARWVAGTPAHFVFAVKASRYMTHMKRLTDLEPGLERFYAAIAPLVSSPKLGPVLWQLPPNFPRDEERLANALAILPPGRHAFEFRHRSWFTPDVLELLRAYGAALVYADHPEYPRQPLELTADWAFIRFHYGRRGRRGNYSESELREWSQRLTDVRERTEVFAYFNNDWEGFAVANARRLRELLDA
jgi:uncharacterized protein YecE (DUF72 family)